MPMVLNAAALWSSRDGRRWRSEQSRRGWTGRLPVASGSPVLVSAAFGAVGSNGATGWIYRVANFVRFCTFRAQVFDYGDTFPSRPRREFNRRQLEGELTEAGFSPTAFYRWGPFGAIVCPSVQREADYCLAVLRIVSNAKASW